MSLLTNEYDINDLEVAVGYLQTILIAGINSSYPETAPVVKGFMDQYAVPINPSDRLPASRNSMTVTIRPRSSGLYEIVFLTLLPGQTEWSSIGFTWESSTSRKPIINVNLNQLVTAHNCRRGDNKYFYALPQEMFKPLYEILYVYWRKQFGYLQF